MHSSDSLVATAILATYNAASTLPACLDSLMRQSVPIEIIVVDDGSTDESLRILDRYPSIHVVRQNHAGPAIARNRGVGKAKTDILLFVDADMTFDKDYVRDLVGPIITKNVVGTYTANEKVSNWDNIWAKCWNWQEGWAPGLRFPADAPNEGTDFRAIRRSGFIQVGGFDNIGYTDTWTLFQKLGVRPHKTMALCYHKNPGSLPAVYRQARWSAKRPYKLGFIGALYALARTSLPISIVIGCITAIKVRSAAFMIFKIVYDWGRFVGILGMITTGSKIK